MQGTPLVKDADMGFIATLLEIYKGLNDDNRNIVLAFVRGMEFQHELELRGKQ